MDITSIIISALAAGFAALIDYLSKHVLTCLVPAFFIAGAMSALLPKEVIVKTLGKGTSKFKTYPLAVMAGLLLAVCSCTILPLFAGIRKKGAGLGPALAFLYTAPATNILAISLTGSVLGWHFAFSRIVLSVTFAIVIGIIVSKAFPDPVEGTGEKKGLLLTAGSSAQTKIARTGLSKFHLPIFFAVLIGILVAGTRLSGIAMWITLAILVMLTLVLTSRWFNREERASWMLETWVFFKKIFPLLIVGIFIAGMLTEFIPQNFLVHYVGGNSILANFFATIFGVVMYFPTLVEVPMAKLFLSLGMGQGPLLAYLLADPVISFASILVVRKIIGTKRTVLYALLITVFCTLAGLIYGTVAGGFA